MKVPSIIIASLVVSTLSSNLFAGFDEDFLKKPENALAVYHYGYELYKNKIKYEDELEKLNKEIERLEKKYQGQSKFFQEQKTTIAESQDLLQSSYGLIESNLSSTLKICEDLIKSCYEQLSEKQEIRDALIEKIKNISEEKAYIQKTPAGKKVCKLLKNGQLAQYKDLNGQRLLKISMIKQLKETVEKEKISKELMDAMIGLEEKNVQSDINQDHFKCDENTKINEYIVGGNKEEKKEKEVKENKEEKLENNNGYGCIIA